MYIDCDGIKLKAYLDMPPEAPTKCPLCIIIHGFTGHSEERHIVAVQEALNEIGIAHFVLICTGMARAMESLRIILFLSGSQISWQLLTTQRALTLLQISI